MYSGGSDAATHQSRHVRDAAFALPQAVIDSHGEWVIRDQRRLKSKTAGIKSKLTLYIYILYILNVDSLVPTGTWSLCAEGSLGEAFRGRLCSTVAGGLQDASCDVRFAAMLATRSLLQPLSPEARETCYPSLLPRKIDYYYSAI
jgi:hypothetical protein